MTDTLLDPNTNDLPPVDPDKNYLEELVGEGKKFKTPEDLAKGKYIADNYVKTLESRLDELRNDYLRLREEATARARLEELVDKLTSQNTTSSEQNHNANELNEKPVFKPEEIESLVSSKIHEYEMTKKQQENFNQVKAKLRERFGDNYQAALKQQIDSLGLTEDFVNDLAKKHPTVLFKTLGLDQEATKENFQSPPKTNVRSDSFGSTPAKKRTWSYYQQLKRENPKAYHDPKTTIQMHQDMLDLGDAFKDGDWYRV